MQQKSCDWLMAFRGHTLHLILLILQDASLPHSEQRLTKGSSIEGRELALFMGMYLFMN